MFGRSLPINLTHGKRLAAAAAIASIALGACVPMAPIYGPNPGGGGQPGANPIPATYVTASECTQRTGNNGGRGFWDIGLSQCYSCPTDSARTVFDVRSGQACQSGGVFGPMTSAENLGGSGCPTGSFQSGGSCYSCPGGTRLDTSSGAPVCI